MAPWLDGIRICARACGRVLGECSDRLVGQLGCVHFLHACCTRTSHERLVCDMMLHCRLWPLKPLNLDQEWRHEMDRGLRVPFPCSPTRPVDVSIGGAGTDGDGVVEVGP